MNVQDLMIPRVKVVSGYPDSPYKVGDIMVFDGDLTIHPNGMDITSKYPHIFQPLPWYAERDIEDIPKYVRVNIKGHGEKIFHVKEWIDTKLSEDLSKRWFVGAWDNTGCRIFLYQCIPATEQEYTDFITQKSKL